MAVSEPVADTRCRAIVRGGGPCRCGGWSRWRMVDRYEECWCGHTRGMHGPIQTKGSKR